MLTALVMLGGCAVRDDFTYLTTKNVKLETFQIDKKKSLGIASGQDCQAVVLFFIPTSGPPSFKQAVDNALASKNGNILADARVEWNLLNIGIFRNECYVAEGEAYDTYK